MPPRQRERGKHVTLILAVSTALAIGCGEDPAREAEEAAAADEAARTARADSVARAERQFDPSVFDTLTWEGSETRVARGRTVFVYSCVKCHGFDGRGGGDLAKQHDLAMPDLRAEGWEYAGDVPAIQRRVYIGHESEMPTWGLYGLSYRDIDAVAAYIVEELRAEE